MWVHDKNGHVWGRLHCTVCGDTQAIFSTPRSADNHAKALHRFGERHQHRDKKKEGR